MTYEKIPDRTDRSELLLFVFESQRFSIGPFGGRGLVFGQLIDDAIGWWAIMLGKTRPQRRKVNKGHAHRIMPCDLVAGILQTCAKSTKVRNARFGL